MTLWDNTMKQRFLAILILNTGLIASGCMAMPGPTPATDASQDLHAFVAATDTLLAYKAADLYQDGVEEAVIVVRHKISGKSDYDFDDNPCELLVLQRRSGKLIETDRSKEVVDCTYNDVARSAPAMSLNDNLSVAPGSITYINQKDKGDSTFYFAWSKEKSTWFLQRATASNPDGSHVANVSASYPKDFAWTTMSAVDPDAIAQILEKHGNATK
jgi:hypothetical protein